MGEYETHPETDVERLQREAEKKLAELKATLNELDDARARMGARQITPEDRRRAFRVVQGGAAAVGAAAVWAWETARKPALVMVAGTGALTTGAIITAPMVEPGTAAPPPAVVTRTPVPVDDVSVEQDAQRDRSTPEPVAETPTPSAVAKVPVAPAEEPFTPAQTPKPKLSPIPSPTPTATATVAPLVEIDVNADSDEACLDSELVGLELAVCLEAATR